MATAAATHASAMAECVRAAEASTTAVPSRSSETAERDRVLASNTVYFDWARDHIDYVIGESPQEYKALTLNDLLDLLDAPHTLYGECTFESFEPDRREAFIERCRRDGHTLLVYNPRATAGHRRTLGVSKTDIEDARTIREAVRDGRHFAPPPVQRPDYMAKLGAACLELRNLRREFGEFRQGPQGGMKYVSSKDLFAERVAKELPSIEELPAYVRTAFCSSKLVGSKNNKREEWSWRLTPLAAIAVAAKYARNTKEFDFISGLYQNGYPSQIRSDLHWWTWGRPNKTGMVGVGNVLSWSEYRWACRWLFHVTASTTRPSGTADSDRTTDEATARTTRPSGTAASDRASSDNFKEDDR